MAFSLLLPGGEGVAQDVPDIPFAIERFGVDEGLPGNYITDLAQTGDGLLWVLASGWLFRFDGSEFERSELRPLSSPPGRRVVGMAAGRGDTLWAVTAGGELLSHSGGRTASHARHDLPLYDVWQGGDGRLWARDQRAVWRLGSRGFERIVDNPMGWVTWRGARQRDQVAVDRSGGDLWVRDVQGGVLALRGDSILTREASPFPALIVESATGRALAQRRSGPLTEVLDAHGRALVRLPYSADRIPRLLDRRGLLWTTSSGRIEAWGLQGLRATLPLDRGAAAADMMEDDEGNLWVGTETEGLYRVRQLPVRLLGRAHGLTDGQVHRLSSGGGSRVLVLDAEGRLTRLGPEGVDTLLHPTAVRRATAALEDRRGREWLALEDERGVRLIGSRAGARAVEVPLPVAPERIVEDPTRDGILWLVGQGGAQRVDAREGTGAPVVGQPILGDWQLREVMITREGVVWLGGAAGVARVTHAGIEEFPGERYPTFRARAFHEDGRGNVWIGRYFGGLVRFRDGVFREVGSRNGLADDVVSSILADDRGNLWMGSNRGVHRVSLAELDDFLEGRLPRVHGWGYGKASGFSNPESSGWHGYRTPDGRLWFPTFGGVAIIDPAEALALVHPPRVRIRSLRSGNGPPAPVAQETDPAADVAGDDVGLLAALPRGVRTVEIAFGAIALSDPASVRYEVRLEGVEAAWTDVGAQRRIAYGNLEPGRHRFSVRARNGTGPARAGVATLLIVVPPLFHETAAFYLLVSALVVTAGLGIHRLGVRGLRSRQAALARLIGERTEQLTREKARAEEALARVAAQADELRSLDEAKSRLFATVSHEIRTPLTLILGPLEDVVAGRLGALPDAVRREIEVAHTSSRRLGELVEQLLDVARLESGEMRPGSGTTEAGPLLERLASSFGTLARRQGIVLETSFPHARVRALVERDALEKVLGNLLANAIKFTPAGGTVRLGAEVERESLREMLVVTVEDDGIGIPAEHQRKVFDRFHRVDETDYHIHGGLGLGLSLVKEITELYGGSVSLWSRQGSGSRFTVRVPATSGDDGGRRSGEGADPLHGNGGAGAAKAAPALDEDRPAVLIVEDHEDLRRYLRRHLEPDYRVVEACDGQHGLKTARTLAPDLIVADVMMPGMDGVEMLAALRADPETSFVPVILLTARASRDSRLGGLRAGADDYLAKPFDPVELRLRIDNQLAARRRMRERLAAGNPHRPDPPPLPARGAGRREDPFAESLRTLLAENLGDETFDVDRMARALAMSRASLYRRVTDTLATTPMELLWRTRLEQAARWLRETDATVGEIAYASGFKSVPHFTRRFRERFGSSPAAFRARDGGDGDVMPARRP